MIGGLWKSASRVAMLAAAGVFVGGVAMPSAKAADLGGDCCADLEERVAELEATTARKGNRKMSLTITGQVNKVVQYYNDGFNSGTRFGLDNTNSSSRFSFLGEARVTPSVKIGFEIMLETEGVNTTSRQSITNEDGNFSGTTYQSATVNQNPANASNSDSFFGDARRAAFWIEDKTLGRVTIGRYEGAGVVNTIDLGGISVMASSSVALLTGNFSLRNGNGGIISTATWGSFLDPAAAQGRNEVIRYDSPTIYGFIVSASASEELSAFQGLTAGAMIRYAGEFSGFRVAAGIGWEGVQDRWIKPAPSLNAVFDPLKNTGAPTLTINNGLINNGTTFGSGNSQFRPNLNAWGGSLATLHVPSGLFLQGEYQKVNYGNAGSATTGYWGETCGASTSGGTNVSVFPIAGSGCNPKADAYHWQVQGGITKNWFGYGNTALYGEYNRLVNWGAEIGGRLYDDANLAPAALGLMKMGNVQTTDVRVWGLGIVQNIDSAATELYLGWRHFDLEVNASAVCTTGAPGGIIGNTGLATGTVTGCDIAAFDTIVGGARVKF